MIRNREYIQSMIDNGNIKISDYPRVKWNDQYPVSIHVMFCQQIYTH